MATLFEESEVVDYIVDQMKVMDEKDLDLFYRQFLIPTIPHTTLTNIRDWLMRQDKTSLAQMIYWLKNKNYKSGGGSSRNNGSSRKRIREELTGEELSGKEIKERLKHFMPSHLQLEEILGYCTKTDYRTLALLRDLYRTISNSDVKNELKLHNINPSKMNRRALCGILKNNINLEHKLRIDNPALDDIANLKIDNAPDWVIDPTINRVKTRPYVISSGRSYQFPEIIDRLEENPEDPVTGETIYEGIHPSIELKKLIDEWLQNNIGYTIDEVAYHDDLIWARNIIRDLSSHPNVTYNWEVYPRRRLEVYGPFDIAVSDYNDVSIHSQIIPGEGKIESKESTGIADKAFAVIFAKIPPGKLGAWIITEEDLQSGNVKAIIADADELEKFLLWTMESEILTGQRRIESPATV